MSFSITTGIDVYPDNDEQHACASIRRNGGGVYRVTLVGEDIGPLGERVYHDFPDIEAAQAFADDIAALVEADPLLTNPASVHQRALAVQAVEELARTKAEHQNELLTVGKRVAALEAELAEAKKG